MKHWIKAFRLRTLPLSLSSIFLGSILAAIAQSFRFDIFLLATLTTLFLQILSNLANDLGDSISGADNQDRVGPQRAVQSGAISLTQMKRMVIVFTILSLVSGIALLALAIQILSTMQIAIMFVIGLMAIAAAINYTVGKNPYGYNGFGDMFVFLFFGLVGVMGTYFLHTADFNPLILLPAASVGFFSVGVLNLNNMRDIENDKKSGKRTLVVKIGGKNARIYHQIIIALAMILALTYQVITWHNWWQLMVLVSFPLFIRNMIVVAKNRIPADLDPQLKQLALSTLLFCLLFLFSLIQ